MDVFGVDTFFDELQTIAFPKVDVPTEVPSCSPKGKRTMQIVGVHERVFLGDSLHWEICLGKKVINFIAYFETFGTYAWTNDGVKVRWLCAIGGLEHIDVGFDDAFLCAFPTCMHSRNDVSRIVPQENGDAVSCLYTNKNVGKLGGEGIYSIECQYLLKRILGEEVLVDNDSLGAMHLMVRHEKSRNRDGNTAISCGGEGGDM